MNMDLKKILYGSKEKIKEKDSTGVYACFTAMPADEEK
jgi:hypothetical protein